MVFLDARALLVLCSVDTASAQCTSSQRRPHREIDGIVLRVGAHRCGVVLGVAGILDFLAVDSTTCEAIVTVHTVALVQTRSGWAKWESDIMLRGAQHPCSGAGLRKELRVDLQIRDAHKLLFIGVIVVFVLSSGFEHTERKRDITPQIDILFKGVEEAREVVDGEERSEGNHETSVFVPERRCRAFTLFRLLDAGNVLEMEFEPL